MSMKRFELGSLVDMSQSLAGATIYIESRYYPGWWVGSSDSYNGYIYELSERSVYNPSEPCRIEVVDCYDGYVCLILSNCPIMDF